MIDILVIVWLIVLTGHGIGMYVALLRTREGVDRLQNQIDRLKKVTLTVEHVDE